VIDSHADARKTEPYALCVPAATIEAASVERAFPT
jgi:hypothetical protein